jgi:heme-degrading monooxygenase HmoA
MSYAAVTYVNLEGRDQSQGEQQLRNEVIPSLKSLPGFQAARFLRSTDGKTGVGAIIFDSEANLKAALATRPADAPPFESEEIYEVVVEA